jgi:arginase
VVLGPRDGVELEFAGIPRVGDLVTFRDADWLAGVDDDELDATLGPVGDHWWLHVDLDVLSTDALAAVDYPQPGGLDWARLEHVTRVILSTNGCRGASIAIYNPELDSGAAAPRIAEFCRMIAGLLDHERRAIH